MHRNLKLLGLCYRTCTCMYTCVCILINYSKPKPMCAAGSLVTLRNKDPALRRTTQHNLSGIKTGGGDKAMNPNGKIDRSDLEMRDETIESKG